MGKLIEWLGKSVLIVGLGLLVLALAAVPPILWLVQAMPPAIPFIFVVIGFVAGRALGFAAAGGFLGGGVISLSFLAAGNGFGMVILMETFFAMVGALVGAVWRRVRDRPAPLRSFTMDDDAS